MRILKLLGIITLLLITSYLFLVRKVHLSPESIAEDEYERFLEYRYSFERGKNVINEIGDSIFLRVFPNSVQISVFSVDGCEEKSFISECFNNCESYHVLKNANISTFSKTGDVYVVELRNSPFYGYRAFYYFGNNPTDNDCLRYDHVFQKEEEFYICLKEI